MKRLLPSPSEERAILAAFRRHAPARRWWEKKLSDLRRCARCGEPLSRRRVAAEGRSRWLCDACGLIAYQNPKIVAATLPIRDGRVVLLRRAIEPAHGKWTYPAGFMELGETVEDAARRETWEEICSRVTITGPARLYAYPDAAVVTIVYEARVPARAPRPGVESLEVRWFAPHEIPWRDLAFRSTYHALKEWVETLPRER